MQALPIRTNYQGDHFNFEWLARTTIEDTNANWLIGFEYTRNDLRQSISSGAPIFNNSRKQESSFQFFLLKAGIGGFFNLSQDGTHRFFSNMIMNLGIAEIDSTTSSKESWGAYGGDINVGYEWVINQVFSISPRYRAQFLYVDTENKTRQDGFTILHGPELHFVFRL